MLDTATPGPGHNNPPAYDPQVLALWTTKTDDFMRVSEKWRTLEKIEEDKHAEQMTDQIDGLRGLKNKIEEARVAAKKPHDDAGKEVQAAFMPLLEKLEKAAKVLKAKLKDYADEKDRIEREAKAKREEEARKAKAEAEALAKKAEESGTISDEIDAKAAQKAAKQTATAARRKVSTGVKSASGVGRTLALRTTKHVEITNINALFMALRDEPEVVEALTRVATRIVRAKGFDGTLAGVKVTETKAVA